MIETPEYTDYIKATAIWFPELELKEFGCEELCKVNDVLKVNLQELQEDIKVNIPLIFYEYSEGTVAEKNELKVFIFMKQL